MSRDAWESAIARAVVDRPFRARLLADPEDSFADYALDDDERRVVAELMQFRQRLVTLEDLATMLLRRLR